MCAITVSEVVRKAAKGFVLGGWLNHKACLPPLYSMSEKVFL